MEQMFAKAVSIHEKGSKILEPGGLVKDPIDALSLGLALMFGTAGLAAHPDEVFHRAGCEGSA